MWWSSPPGRARRRSSPGSVGRRRGFTLLEAIVALAITGFAIVAMTGAFGEGLRAARDVDRHLVAAALADARLGALAALPLDSLRRAAGERDGAFAAPFGAYRWRSRVREVRDRPGLVQLSTTVRWTGGEYTLATTVYHHDVWSGALWR